MYLNRDMDGVPFLVYFLPILGGQKATVLDSVEGCVHPVTSELSGCRSNRWTTGWMTNGWMDWTNDGMDDRTDSGEASFLIPTSFTLCLSIYLTRILGGGGGGGGRDR
jgi:hypothetical protein